MSASGASLRKKGGKGPRKTKNHVMKASKWKWHGYWKHVPLTKSANLYSQRVNIGIFLIEHQIGWTL